MRVSNAAEIIEALKPYDIISFDIYDTLVLRDLSAPTRIFDVMEPKYRQMQKGNESLPRGTFRHLRSQAEKTARSATQSEVSLKDIYLTMDLTEKDRECLQNLECEMEIAFSRPNRDVAAAFRYAINSGKRVILVSDMYLPKEVIALILKHCGYEGYEKLFVSSEIKSRKHDGSIWQDVLNYLGCDSSAILHVGDNFKSDVQVTKSCGVSAIWYRRRYIKLDHYCMFRKQTCSLQEDVLKTFLLNTLSELDGDAIRIGYEILGPLLTGFCQWLREHSLEMDKFFLARDGYLIMEAYKQLYPQDTSRMHYIYVSRKALRRPSVAAGMGYEEFVKQLPSLKTYTVVSFLDMCSASPEVASNLVKQFNWIEPVQGRDRLKHSTEFKQLYYEWITQDEYKIKQQLINLKEYLSGQIRSDYACIIDVGWRCSAQINLGRILSTDVEMEGFYFGLEGYSDFPESLKSHVHGYLWANDRTSRIAQRILNGRKALFECMFLSAEGSTISYEQGIDGRAFPLLDSEAPGDESGVVADIQKGALLFVKQFKELSNFIPRLEAHDLGRVFVDFILYPTNGDMVYGEVQCENYRTTRLADPSPLSSYLRGQRKLSSDFFDAEWKVGFIKRLLCLPTPMMVILNRLYEFARRHS